MYMVNMERSEDDFMELVLAFHAYVSFRLQAQVSQ